MRAEQAWESDERKEPMTAKHPGPPPKLWAYAYEILPAQPERRLRSIRSLLEQARSDAKHNARTWEARYVLERQITHILVVTDSPDQASEPNRRLEAALMGLRVGFSLTAPMTVDTPDGGPAAQDPTAGKGDDGKDP